MCYTRITKGKEVKKMTKQELKLIAKAMCRIDEQIAILQAHREKLKNSVPTVEDKNKLFDIIAADKKTHIV